jgi:hypothetical protein
VVGGGHAATTARIGSIVVDGNHALLHNAVCDGFNSFVAREETKSKLETVTSFFPSLLIKLLATSAK